MDSLIERTDGELLGTGVLLTAKGLAGKIAQVQVALDTWQRKHGAWPRLVCAETFPEAYRWAVKQATGLDVAVDKKVNAREQWVVYLRKE